MSGKEQNVAFTIIDGGKRAEPKGDYIDDVFGAGGRLSHLLDGYAPREGQIQMARAIDKGIRTGNHVIVEGPTGTGKSLAYSVPAAFHAVYHGLSSCIVTGNKNLQRQVYEKDLALLKEAVPDWNFSFALRKGISSYLCERDFLSGKWEDFLRGGNLSVREEELVRETADWAQYTGTGDFEESPGPGFKIWSQFATNRDECQGKKCSAFDDCYVAEAKKRAEGADIIVTNYHMLFTHLKLGPGSKVLPPFDVVILDEAHRAAKTARDFFGVEITFGSIYRCVTNMHLVPVRGYKQRGEVLRSSLLNQARILWDGLAARARSRDSIFDGRNKLRSQKLEALLAEAATLYGELSAKSAPPPPPEGALRGAMAGRLEAESKNYALLRDKCIEKQSQLFSFREAKDDGSVYFIHGSGHEKQKNVILKSKAIEVGGQMRNGLFDRFPTVVQTSATLAIRGGKKGAFEYLRNEMGMNGLENVSELTVESPFDWNRQGLLVIPKSMREYVYGETAWGQDVCEHFEKIVNIVGGRTLGLFTSFRMLNMVADHLRKKTDFTFYVQGEATNRELAEKFQKNVGSVLLGTDSFSEGISIEGEACSCVVLDKIPFTPKNDPVMHGIERALKARGSTKGSFFAYSLPEAIISFKQRVGRLIRTVDDVGVAVVLDKRLHTKKYRRGFISSVPFDWVHDSLDSIEPFLRRNGKL